MNIGPYRIIRKLGEGGMSSVFLTEDIRTARVVALKLLAPRVVADEVYRLRLLREAHVISSLKHPNITALYEADQFLDQPYLAVEYVEGESVADLVVAGPFPVDRAVRIAADVASALAAAHAAGIVHRDIKPSNVMIQPWGGVKVMDFGLAKFEEIEGDADSDETGEIRNLTARGTILGTIHYMCPEQASGEPVDSRADIFSLGVLLYEMLTGRAPFVGPHTLAVLEAIRRAEPVPVGELRANVPDEVSRIVARAMAKEPDERYETAAEMERALREALARIP
jgi:serine/threonine protein kinase